jgi:hypothetical protein
MQTILPQRDADLPFDLTLSLSKGEVDARRLPKSSILRQAQDEDFGPPGSTRQGLR